MSDTYKEGKRGRRLPHLGKPETPGIWGAWADRHCYGSTEKILRRCRKIWTRLANKRRRVEDGKRVREEDDPGTPTEG